MTTAYGASLSPEKLEILPALIKDLEILEESKNVSDGFPILVFFLLMFSTYFFPCSLSSKINFFSLFSTEDSCCALHTK